MKIGNQVDTAGGGDGKFIDSREIKKSKEGIKVRLYGDAEMGYSKFIQDDEGKFKVIRSTDVPDMSDASEGFQGAEQKPTKNLYIVAWNYATEAPCLLTLDKVSLINGIFAVNDDTDLKSATDYDFKMTFDDTKQPQEKYKVIRLDASPLTAEQKKELKAFAETVDLAGHAAGDDQAF